MVLECSTESLFTISSCFRKFNTRNSQTTLSFAVQKIKSHFPTKHLYFTCTLIIKVQVK